MNEITRFRSSRMRRGRKSCKKIYKILKSPLQPLKVTFYTEKKME